MTSKVFNLVKVCIMAAQSVAVGVVTYCVEDTAVASSVNAAIVVIGTAAVEVCSKFVKD